MIFDQLILLVLPALIFSISSSLVLMILSKVSISAAYLLCLNQNCLSLSPLAQKSCKFFLNCSNLARSFWFLASLEVIMCWRSACNCQQQAPPIAEGSRLRLLASGLSAIAVLLLGIGYYATRVSFRHSFPIFMPFTTYILCFKLVNLGLKYYYNKWFINQALARQVRSFLMMKRRIAIMKTNFNPGFFLWTGLGIGQIITGPKFLRLGNFVKNSNESCKSSSFSSSCCSSWNPLGKRWYSLQGLTLLQINCLDNSGSVTVSSLPWKILTGQRNQSACNFTQSRASKICLAILTDMKGNISRSPKIVCMYYFFLVNAVGLTCDPTIKSERWSPRCRMNCFLTQLKCIFLANPSKGLVIMHPLTLMSLFSSRSLIVTRPPRLCAQMNNGRSDLARLNSRMTSFWSSLTQPQPRAPPEYPKPLRSTVNTSNQFLAKKVATDLNRCECSPNPWMITMVYLGFGGLYFVWYSLIWGISVSMYSLQIVNSYPSNLPTNSSYVIILYLIYFSILMPIYLKQILHDVIIGKNVCH